MCVNKRLIITLFIVVCLIVSFGVSAQIKGGETGIHFELGIKWRDILKMAKRQKKGIFLDCYATWCGPCKYMEKKIFSSEAVGKLFNETFINVRVQLDSTSKDDVYIKNWYEDSRNLKVRYKITAFPTFLFFDTEGQVVHKFCGSSDTDSLFLEKVKNVFDPEWQYYLLVNNWGKHLDDSAFLVHAIIAAENADDYVNAGRIANHYFSSLKNRISKFSIGLLDPLKFSENDWMFPFLLNNSMEINREVGAGYVEQVLGDVIFNAKIVPVLLNTKSPLRWDSLKMAISAEYESLNQEKLQIREDLYFRNFIGNEIIKETGTRKMSFEEFDKIESGLAIKYPGYDFGQLLGGFQIQYFSKMRMWTECSKVALIYIQKYSSRLEDRQINDICWSFIFLHSGDAKMLNEALNIMKQVVRNGADDCANVDTYANLLYKTGSRKDAITSETENVERALKKGLYDETEFRENLRKMKEGIPTWDDNLPVPPLE